MSEFKYLGCVLNEAGTDRAECSRKVTSGRRVVRVIWSPVNATDLQPECTRVLMKHCLYLFLYMAVRQC